MAHIAIELPCSNDSERKFVDMARMCVDAFKGDDCRELRTQLRHFAGTAGIEVEIGCGGSHVWVHRLSEHIDGDPVNSKRFVVVTDTPIWEDC